jgi:hypothetical protein
MELGSFYGNAQPPSLEELMAAQQRLHDQIQLHAANQHADAVQSPGIQAKTQSMQTLLYR